MGSQRNSIDSSLKEEKDDLVPIINKNSPELRSDSKIIKGRKAGKGTYGVVYHGTTDTNEKVAVKRNLIDTNTDFIGSLREMDLLMKLKGHPNIVELRNISFGSPFNNMMSPIRQKYCRDDSVHFVFENAECDGLQFIYYRKVNYLQCKVAMMQILLGVEYMHAKGFIHRDIKPQNTLCFEKDNKMCFKLCDFGLSKPYTTQGVQSPKVVTSWYRAPEICSRNPKYTQKSDIWSVGCIFFEMISKRALLKDAPDSDNGILTRILKMFPDMDEHHNVRKMIRQKPADIAHMSSPNRKNTLRQLIGLRRNQVIQFDSECTGGLYNSGSFDNFIDLLAHMLAFDSDNRYSATEALDHRFFDAFRPIIDSTRQKHPPEKNPPEILYSINCPERHWGSNIALSVFSHRDGYNWYKDRILFQAIDIFDRYLIYLSQTKEKITNNNDVNIGLFLNKYEANLYFTVCLYVSIKYFLTMEMPISYKDLATKDYQTKEAMVKAERFESFLIRTVLNYQIYRETVYEVADRNNDELTDNDIKDLLLIFGKVSSYEGITALKLYQLYRHVRPSKNSK